MSNRHEFSLSTKTTLAKRAGYRCSLCDCNTVGPSNESSSAVTMIGVAAHITAASPGGKRFDPTLSEGERKHIDNAIWLCQNHGTLVDDDDVTYTVEGLKEIKRQHEDRVAQSLVDPKSNTNLQADLRCLQEVTKEIIDWPSTLDGQRHIERAELSTLTDALNDDDQRVVALLGSPGSGKSSLLSKVPSSNTGSLVLGFRCESIPRPVSTVDQLSEWLGVSESLDRVVRRLATKEKVVLLIDQFDALCDLVDLHSDRIDALLSLIRRLRDIPNVHVVLGCRDFDFKHDQRLRALAVEPIELGLPEWSVVTEVLESHGIDGRSFPSNLQTLLRVPQQLKLFLALEKPLADLSSYQSILERFWSERVGCDEERVKLVGKFVDAMANDESLSAPIALADGKRSALDALEKDGVLRTDPQGKTVSFCHQTLFDFARARSFVDSTSFVQHVKERQGALFVRPTVWTTLTYLRGARRARYEDQFAQLWNDPELRLHLRVLLVEFLGSLDDPSDGEVEILVAALQDVRTRAAALTATVGSPAWFNPLESRGIIAGAVVDAPNYAVAQLAAAIPFAADRVLKILESFEATETNDVITIRVLNSAVTFDARMRDLAIRVLKRRTLPRHELSGLLATARESDPRLAIEMLRELTKRLEPSAIFETTAALFELETLAYEAPIAFLDSLIPVYERALDGKRRPDSSRFGYVDTDSLQGCFDAPHLAQLASALLVASETAASQHPDQFIEIVERLADNADLNATHSLLAVGLARLPPTHVLGAVAYLTGDARRLVIGGLYGEDEITRRLMLAIKTHLTTADVEKIEPMVFSSSLVDETKADSKSRLRWSKLNRRHRLRLLTALPESLLSDRARSTIDQDGRAFPDAEQPSVVFEGDGLIGSTMSASEMDRASDDDIVKLFEELTDDTGFEHPVRRMEGGSIQASREFEQFSKTKPDRSLAILDRLSPKLHERPVAHALVALGAVGDPRFPEAVIVADKRGFRSEEFRWQVTNAIGAWGEAHEGSPDELCSLLRMWLSESGVDGDEDELGDEQHARSILYGMQGGGLVPRGGVPMMRALFGSLLYRKPPAVAEWLDALETRLNDQGSLREWRAIAHDLANLRLAPDRASNFLQLLFSRYPVLLATQPGAILLAHAIDFTDASTIEDLRALQEKMESPFARQAAGELLVHLHWRRPSEGTKKEIASHLKDDVDSPTALGVSHGMAANWLAPQLRSSATDWIVDRLPLAKEKELEALVGALRGREELPSDEATLKVLEQLVASGEALFQAAPFVIEKLGTLLPAHAAFVGRFAHAILDECERVQQSPSSLLGYASTAFIDLSLTLQRTSASRAEGMRLFERLLGLGFYGTDDVLFEIDGRPVRRRMAPVRRRPLRPRRRN